MCSSDLSIVVSNSPNAHARTSRFLSGTFFSKQSLKWATGSNAINNATKQVLSNAVQNQVSKNPAITNALKNAGATSTSTASTSEVQFKDNGELATPAHVTAFLNGVLVQNNTIVQGPVEWIGLPKYKKHADKMPIYIQDHGMDGGLPVSFRNIWIRPL